MAKTKIQLPEGVKKDDLVTLGSDICREIQSSISMLGSLPDRWKKNEAIDKCDPTAVSTDFVEGSSTYPMPLATQRNDRIAGSVFDAITGLDPWVQCIADDDNLAEIADKVEKDLHFLAIKSGLETPLYQSLRAACNTNIALMRCCVDEEKGLFTFHTCHPQNFIAYPCNSARIEDLKTVGHRIRKMEWEVKKKQDEGEYLEGPITSGEKVDQPWDEAGRSDSFDKVETENYANSDDEPVILYEFETRRIWKGELRKFRGLVVFATQLILEIEDLEYTRTRWQDLRYDPEDGRWWPASSPTQRMQGLQIAYTDCINTVLQGAKAAAGPPIGVRGGNATNQKLTTYKPFSLIELAANQELQPISISFRGEYLMGLAESFERQADGVSRISSVGMGQESSGNKTATEIAGVLEGQRQGEGMYLSTASYGVEALWALMFEYYQYHFDDFKVRWGDALQIKDKSEIETVTLRFEVTGRSGSNNPATVAQKMQMLLQLAMNPQSVLDFREVEKATVNALKVPGSSKLLKPEDPLMGIQQAIVDALMMGVPPEQAMQAAMQTVQGAAMAVQAMQMEANGGANGDVQEPGMGNPSALPGNTEAAAFPAGLA